LPSQSIAASTFGGNIGSSLSRWPVAGSLTLATAAIDRQIGFGGTFGAVPTTASRHGSSGRHVTVAADKAPPNGRQRFQPTNRVSRRFSPFAYKVDRRQAK
jgi:hypothetical protein